MASQLADKAEQCKRIAGVLAAQVCVFYISIVPSITPNMSICISVNVYICIPFAMTSQLADKAEQCKRIAGVLAAQVCVFYISIVPSITPNISICISVNVYICIPFAMASQLADKAEQCKRIAGVLAAQVYI